MNLEDRKAILGHREVINLDEPSGTPTDCHESAPASTMLKRKLSEGGTIKYDSNLNERRQSDTQSVCGADVADHDPLRDRNQVYTPRAEPFILVLIDGDNTLFREEYIRQGLQGGHRAAQELIKEIEQFQRRRSSLAHCRVVLRLYWNLRGLTAAYVRLGHGSHDTMRAFSRAFNKERPLFECVDAGDDKEAADNKIKANFDLYWHNSQCQHIVLAASGDRGYVGFLRQYVPSMGVSSRLTLLEARAFHPDFNAVISSFETVRWSVFRSDALKPSMRSNIPPDNGYSDSPPLLARAGMQSSEMSPAILAWREQQKRSSTFACHSTSQVGTKGSAEKLLHIQYNCHNQRIDADQTVENLDIDSLRVRRLCNKFYLSKCQDLHCNKEHSVILDAVELEHLRAFAQMLPCRTIYCSDPTCVSGHQCSNKHCVSRKDCKFSGAMHTVDTDVVRLDTFTFDDLQFLSSRNFGTRRDTSLYSTLRP